MSIHADGKSLRQRVKEVLGSLEDGKHQGKITPGMVFRELRAVGYDNPNVTLEVVADEIIRIANGALMDAHKLKLRQEIKKAWDNLEIRGRYHRKGIYPFEMLEELRKAGYSDPIVDVAAVANELVTGALYWV